MESETRFKESEMIGCMHTWRDRTDHESSGWECTTTGEARKQLVIDAHESKADRTNNNGNAA